MGATLSCLDVDIGKQRMDPSYARIRVTAPDQKQLKEILAAVPGSLARRLWERGGVTLAQAPADGIFPDGFYVTTSYPTQVRYGEEWIPVEHQRMDCGIGSTQKGSARRRPSSARCARAIGSSREARGCA